MQIGDVTDQNISITGFLNATYVATTAINVSPIQSRVSNLGQQNLINTVLPNQPLCAIAGTSTDPCVPSAEPNPSSIVDIIRAEIRAVLPEVIASEIPRIDTPINKRFERSTVNMADTQQQHSSVPSALPSISADILQKIKRGEFVNFDKLLPHAVAPSSSDDFAIRLDQSGGEPASLSLVPRSQSSKAKVFDFLSWLQAWNNFVRAFVYYHPHTMSQLLYYQAMVCDYFNQYTFNDVYAYYRNFRQRMAALPDLRWGRHDQELVAKFLRTNKLVCFRCRNFGHVASACSLFPTGSDASFARPASQQPAQRFSQSLSRSRPFSNTGPHNPPGQIVSRQDCWFFNTNGFCNNNRCQSMHRCSTCSGSHPKFMCKPRR